MNPTFVVRFIGEEGEAFVAVEQTFVVAHTSPTRRTPLRRRNSGITLRLRVLSPSVTSILFYLVIRVPCLVASLSYR